MAVTLGALTARIQQEVNRPSSRYIAPIHNAIVTAIQFYEKTPLYFNETTATLTLASGASSVLLPVDYGSMIDLKIYATNRYLGTNSGFKGAEYVYVSDLLSCNTTPCQPHFHANFAKSIYFDSIADAAYPLKLAYYNIDTIYPVLDSDTSIWFGDGVDIIRYHAMATFYNDTLHSSEIGDPYFDKAALYYDNLTDDNNNRDKFNLMLE